MNTPNGQQFGLTLHLPVGVAITTPNHGLKKNTIHGQGKVTEQVIGLTPN